MFAVIETGGKQYLIETGSIMKIEKLDADQGKDVVFDKVLLIANDDGSSVKMGAPYIEGASLSATVQEQGRSKKIRIVKFKNKIRYTRSRGHRQSFTKVKVKEVK